MLIRIEENNGKPKDSVINWFAGKYWNCIYEYDDHIKVSIKEKDLQPLLFEILKSFNFAIYGYPVSVELKYDYNRSYIISINGINTNNIPIIKKRCLK